MKNDEILSRPKHLTPEHTPTVIHDPLHDETVLARWLRQGMEQGPRFWIAIAGLLGLVAALWFGSMFWKTGDSSESQAWRSLLLASDTASRIKVGETAKGPAAVWALIQAAEAKYLEGFRNLPQSRETAQQELKEAFELFKDAQEKSEKSSHQHFLASLGMARTLEARGELDAAIERYDEIAKAWEKTPMGERAAKLAERLREPASREFYQAFAAYKPESAVLPPGGQGTFDLGLPTAPGNGGAPASLLPELLPPATSTGNNPPATPAPTTPQAP